MAQNQLYLIKSGENSFVEETQAIVGISGGKVGIGTTVPESDFHVAGNTQIDGDLTVKGNFTTVDSTTIQVDDKNIELGVIDSPTNATAHGGGITLKGTTDKTIDWQTGNAAWNFSENLYIANGRHFAGDELRALDAGGLSLFDNNASGITVKAGKVGVHKTSPVYDLDVVGSGNFSAGLYVSGNSVLTGTAADLGKWSDGSTAGEIYYNGGNVGIATNDPAYTLDVVGTGNFTTLTVQGNSVLTGSAADLSKWSDGSTAGEIYYTGGNVGIATNDPAATLDVIGSGNFSAGLYVNGNSVLTGTSENLSKWSSGATAGEIYYTGGNVGIATNNPAYTLDVAGGGNFTSLTVQGNSVLTGTAADLGKWSDGSAGEIYYNGGNVGIATNNPAATLDVNGSLNVEGNFTILDQFNFGSNGSVGGVVPSAVDDIIKWNGTKWVAGANPGGAGAGGGEVPSALINSLISGQSVQSIAFLDTYDTAPRIATELEIDGEGSIIPYVISGVSTTGYNLIFSQEIPNNNYKIHTVFGGKDVYWETGASNSLAYNDGDVSLLRNLSVGGNLTVQGNSVLTGSAADLGKWEDAVSAGEIYYNGGNVGIGTSDPAYSLHVNGTIYNENGGINIANKFNVSTLGAVGGQSPAFNEVIKWDGSKWIAGSAPGGGTSSSSEVPSAFDTWLSQGSAVQPISFVDAPEGGYQSIPSISTDVEIIEGDIIPYAISGVSTTGYYAVFSDPIPTANNYKIHTTFGGKEVYWQTGAGGNSIYYNGDSVSVDDLIVGGNLTVNGTTTTVNTQTVEIEDHNLVIAANTGYNQLTAEYPGAGGAYAGILWGTGDAGAASPVSLTYQSNKGFAFEGGNVGIGTTSPGSKLEILNSSSTTDVDALTFTWEHLNQNAGIEQRIKWRFGDDATPDAPSDAAYIAAGKSNSWDTGAGRQSYLSFATANGINTVQYGGTEPNYSAVERMRIAYNGNVGIGTTNPGAKLHLSTAGADGLRLAVDSQTYYHMIRPNGDGLYLGADDGGTGGSGADIRFSVKGDEKMRIDSAGNVGIGATSPGGKLHVTNLSVSIGNVTVTNTGTGVTGGTSLNTKISNGDRIKINNQIFTVSAVAETTLTLSGTPTSAGTFLAYTDDNALVVTSAGNVGIGTTNPGAYKLVVNDSTANGRIKIGSSSTAAASLFFGEDAGAGGTPAWLQRYGSSHATKPSKVELGAAGSGSWIAIQGDGTDILNVRGSGNVGIGTTNPSFPLHVNGRIEVDNGEIVINDAGIYIGSSAAQNQISTASNGLVSTTLYIGNAAIQVSSDKRLKKNIEDSKVNATSIIKKLRIVDFDWDDPSDNSLNNRNARGRWTGLIAQEAIEHFPTLVNAPRKAEDLSIDMESESIWHLDQGAAIPMLIKAIQEQQQLIDDLKSRIETLEQ